MRGLTRQGTRHKVSPGQGASGTRRVLPKETYSDVHELDLTTLDRAQGLYCVES
uniref:Uncharacterized protein n=1 Tax=Neogobius melanostomus TaxID=47308 RepID=A0A8C6T3X0_9GOBI